MQCSFTSGPFCSFSVASARPYRTFRCISGGAKTAQGAKTAPDGSDPERSVWIVFPLVALN